MDGKDTEDSMVHRDQLRRAAIATVALIAVFFCTLVLSLNLISGNFTKDELEVSKGYGMDQIHYARSKLKQVCIHDIF